MTCVVSLVMAKIIYSLMMLDLPAVAVELVIPMCGVCPSSEAMKLRIFLA
jgi:hypothetical protein